MDILSAEEKKSIRLRTQLMFPWDPPAKLEIGIALQGAYTIAMKTLGVKWVEKNLSPKGGNRRTNFMRRGLASQEDSLVHTDRVIMLAEFLNNLYRVTNFSSKLKDLKTMPLEETCFELQIADSLHKQSMLTKFIVPSKVAGRDYDLAASISKHPICVEVKCRTLESDFTENVLKNPLKHAARKQLPKESANAIFYKFPILWTHERDFPDRAEAVVRKFLRDYSRINVVVLCWEEWINRGVPPFARRHLFKTFANPNPRTPIDGVEHLMKDYGSNLIYTRRNRLGISFI